MIAAPRVNAWLAGRWAKPVLFGAALLPLAYLLGAAYLDQLGANPAEALVRGSGDWTLRMLCIALLITLLRQALSWQSLARMRRMFGLFVFFYALLHFAAYAWLDQGLDGADISADIAKRPFILVGVSALFLLVPLAATSFNAAQRWLGAARWRALHRAVYLVAVLAVLHFFWMRAGKRNFAEVAVYATVLAALLAWRVREALRRRASRPGTVG